MNEILIYSDIGENWMGDGITAMSIKSQVEGVTGDLTIRINSGGGDVFDGFAIYNILNQYEGKKTVYVDGLAASAASVIAMAGDEIIMADNALLMIHDPWTLALGSADEMRNTADLLDKIKWSIVTTYRTKTGIDDAELSQMMSNETWLNAEESILKGFATSTAESQKKVANLEKPWIKNAPKPETIENEDIETLTAWRLAANRRKLSLIE